MQHILSDAVRKSLAAVTILGLMLGTIGLFGSAIETARAATAPNWDTTGSYVAAFNYLGTDYPHDMSLTQDGLGGLTGNGGSPAGANTYTWVITSGSVSGDTIDFTADYTASADAVTPQTTMHVLGTIAPDGTMSGTWSDNYQGGERSGTWASTLGTATATPPQNPETVKVSINKYVDGHLATALSADGHPFTMSSTWNDPAGIGSGSGQYELNSGNSYEAVTSAMQPGADYSTHEVMNDVVGATCSTTQPFALVGYSWGDSWSAAQAMAPTTTMPAFTNMTTDKYVIVWNHDCAPSGSIGGDVVGGTSPQGNLQVTSVTPVQTTATADNTYANGWSYQFNITVPTDETNLSMKFANWFNSSASSTILAGGNMQISSAQADNGGAVVPVNAANTYTVPALHMVTDLDPSTPGIQVQVLVQVKIPSSTVNGSYTTSYGVQTQP